MIESKESPFMKILDGMLESFGDDDIADYVWFMIEGSVTRDVDKTHAWLCVDLNHPDPVGWKMDMFGGSKERLENSETELDWIYVLQCEDADIDELHRRWIRHGYRNRPPRWLYHAAGNDQIIYIGSTTKSIRERISEHYFKESGAYFLKIFRPKYLVMIIPLIIHAPYDLQQVEQIIADIYLHLFDYERTFVYQY